MPGVPYSGGVALRVRADDLRKHGAGAGRKNAYGALKDKLEKSLRN
jgi:hypothetical protein